MARSSILDPRSSILDSLPRLPPFPRVPRSLLSSRRNETNLRSAGEMSHEGAALLAQRPFDAQSIAVELIDRGGDWHGVFGRRQRRIVGLLVAADRVLRRETASDDRGQLPGLQFPPARMLVAEFQREADGRGFGADDVLEQFAAHLLREGFQGFALFRRGLLVKDQDGFGRKRIGKCGAERAGSLGYADNAQTVEFDPLPFAPRHAPAHD